MFFNLHSMPRDHSTASENSGWLRRNWSLWTVTAVVPGFFVACKIGMVVLHRYPTAFVPHCTTGYFQYWPSLSWYKSEQSQPLTIS